MLVWYPQGAQLWLFLSANYHFRYSQLLVQLFCKGSTGTMVSSTTVSTPCFVAWQVCPLQRSWAWFLLQGLFLSCLPTGCKRFTSGILQSAFSPPEQPCCRENAATWVSVGKISLRHILFAVTVVLSKELRRVSLSLDLLCVLWQRNYRSGSCLFDLTG